MTETWANHDNAGTGDVFHALRAGLTVELISTKRPQLMTCALHEALPVVMARNTEPYDFLPVVAAAEGSRTGSSACLTLRSSSMKYRLRDTSNNTMRRFPKNI